MVNYSRQFGKVLLSAILAVAVALPAGPLGCLFCPTCSARGSETGGTDLASATAGQSAPACCELCVPPADECGLNSQSNTPSKDCVAGLGDSTTNHHPCGCCVDKAPPADRAQVSTFTATSLASGHFALPAGQADDLDIWNNQRRLAATSWLAELVPPIPHQVLHCSWLK